MSKISQCGPLRCQLILQHCLAIQLSKPGRTLDDLWMYDSGYMIFQNFLAANSQCWWNTSLTAATHSLKYVGHVAPGMLLVTADPCALEILRGAYARSVLKPPATYVISSVGDIDDCFITPTFQGQFTPLPEALCNIIMDSTAEGESATIENLRTKLSLKFPHITTPAPEIIYDTLTQLMQEEKIFQTSKGFFILTPERRRSQSRNNRRLTYENFEDGHESLQSNRSMLLSNTEALHSLYGEITTKRDGDVTHQCIQTNLADVICGGNPNDKILYPRISKTRSASFTRHHSLKRGHSLKSVGSSRFLPRYASTKSLSKISGPTLITDSSSSEYPSTDSSSPKKGSLFSRLLLFRRSSRTKHKQIETYSGQTPPPEWFNTRYVSLKSVGTQTSDQEIPIAHKLSNSTFYDGSETSQRSTTLPRRHRHYMSSDSTFLLSLRDCSPPRRRSNFYCSSSLPRSTQSIPGGGSYNTSRSSTAAYMNSQKGVPARSSFGDTSTYMPAEKSITATGRRQRDDKSNRSTLSGPSSLESGKSSGNKFYNRCTLSGPSSLESGKTQCIGQNSEPTSIENKVCAYLNLSSQCSPNTNVVQSHPSNSIHKLNASPRSSARFQSTRSQVIKDSKQNTCSTTACLPKIANQQSKTQNAYFVEDNVFNDIQNISTNNSFITLQVTTSTETRNNCLSNKILSEISQEHSVKTLENEKLAKHAIVFSMNNGNTTNKNNKNIQQTNSNQNGMTTKLENRQKSINQNGPFSDVMNVASFITKCAEKKDTTAHLNKLIDNNVDVTTSYDNALNNNRQEKLQAQPNANNKSWGYKNNMIKKECEQYLPVEKEMPTKAVINNPNSTISSSVGNLHSFEKNAKEQEEKCLIPNYHNKSVCNVREANSKLNSNQVINSDELQILLQKNVVGSEPNLTLMDRNCALVLDKSLKKKELDRRLSLSKNKTTPLITGEEFLNFPSLTDLSFNFTSLAAQKILQGVSLNDIETFVELNMADTTTNNKENNKKQNNSTKSFCSDYGML